jgi:hypothetical protein
MINLHRFAPFAACVALLLPAPAAASDDALELWLNPSASFALDSDTALEIETAQRLRSRSDGREDTYFARLWLSRDLSAAATLAGAIERRVNDPGADELRLIQQLSTSHGLLRTRLRLEQRFVDGRRMGLRVRPRLGVEVPLDRDERFAFVSNAELFLTLRSTSVGGDDGLTGLRTQIGVEHAVSERLGLSLAYLRQQIIEKGAPDQVGHAPIIGLELSF